MAESQTTESPRAKTGGSRDVRRARANRRRAERREFRRFTVSTRRRRINTVAGVGAMVSLLVTVGVLTTSPVFSLRTIEVTGLDRLDQAAIMSRAEVLLDTPLAQVSPDDVVAVLEDVPLVQSVETRVELPNTLVIDITERIPLGVIQTASGFEVVDGAAVVLWSSDARPSEFPVILVTPSAESEEFRAVVAALTSLPPEVLARVDAVTADSTDTVRFSLRDSLHVVLWGSAEASNQKARALPAALGAAGSVGRKLIDLSTPETVVIREVD